MGLSHGFHRVVGKIFRVPESAPALPIFWSPLLYGSAMKFRYAVAGMALALALAALIMARDLGLF